MASICLLKSTSYLHLLHIVRTWFNKKQNKPNQNKKTKNKTKQNKKQKQKTKKPKTKQNHYGTRSTIPMVLWFHPFSITKATLIIVGFT